MREEIIDSPTGWVSNHIQTYLAGTGYDYHGFPSLLLTTRGRRSGKLRRTPLIFGRHGDSYVVVGSNGGGDDHPLWYLNIEADPSVEVQVHEEVFAAVARDATPAERPGLWALMVGIFPTYDTYRQKTEREIPVVVLTPAPPSAR